MTAIKDIIRDTALAMGFDAAGFAAVRTTKAEKDALGQFLDSGLHGGMDWMARNRGRRADPKLLWPGARTVIALALNYGPGAGAPTSAQPPPAATGEIAAYAKGRDYHDVMKKKLKRLAGWIAREFATEVKVFVDTAPVMEKPLARRAGIGWQGKHTNLVSREFGSWLLLGEVFTSLELAPDSPAADLCGSCDLCIRACPTGAITAPYRLDPRRCLSYLTIEHKDRIADEFKAALGDRIYGCDDCIEVCPWNKFARPTAHAELRPRAELQQPALADLAALDDRAFRQVFSKSPVKRTGRDRMLRNVLIAIGNIGGNSGGNSGDDGGLRNTAEGFLDDPSPAVRDAAAWALGKRVQLADA